MLPRFWGPGCNLDTLIDLANIALVIRHSAENICMVSEGYRTHRGVTGPMNFKKSGRFFHKIVLSGFWDPGCHPCTLIDLVNTALARRDSAKNICMISEGYRTHTVITGPKKFKKGLFFFFRKSCSRDFGALACHPSTLIDFVNTALASKGSVETICMIWVGCRTQRAVTGPMIFKKISIFFGKSCSRNFGAPGCNPSSLIDIANTALARKRSVKPICRISEGYRTHGGVTGPMNLKKKKQEFFFGKTCSRNFGAPGCHPSTLIDLANTALASKGSLETKCMISEGYKTHRGVTGPKNFKNQEVFFSESRAPGILGPLAAIRAL